MENMEAKMCSVRDIYREKPKDSKKGIVRPVIGKVIQENQCMITRTLRIEENVRSFKNDNLRRLQR